MLLLHLKFYQAVTAVGKFAMRLRLSRFRGCNNIGRFHGFATAVWNFALLLRLAGICGKLLPSIHGKNYRKGNGYVVNKMLKIVETNVKVHFLSNETIEICS